MSTTINYPTGVTQVTVANLICNALDSCSIGYWASWERVETPEGFDITKGPDGFNTEEWESKYVAPTMGGALVFSDCELVEGDDKEEWKLDAAAIQKGLDLMPTVSPRAYGDVIADNMDAETGDVFIQICLFGEVVYG